MNSSRLEGVRFGADGLVPVVAQDAVSGEVLMLAYADRQALEATLESGEAHYRSRSRGELWRKGATSGNVQRVVAVTLDCDGDAVLYLVEQVGPACHTGHRTCFHRPVLTPPNDVPLADGAGRGPMEAALRLVADVVARRLSEQPDGSYVASLGARGVGYVSQKVVEEAGETIVAALQGDAEALPQEAADLVFHLGVLLAVGGSSWDAVGEILLARHRDASGSR